MKRGEVHGSLPPQVKGRALGQLVIRVPKIRFKDKRQVNLTGYRVEFTWWGEVSDRPVALSIPWKPGQVIDEAVFPLVVGPTALQGYFSDMGNELELRVFKDSVLLGTSTVPLQQLFSNNMSWSGDIPVKISKNSDETSINVELKTAYDHTKSDAPVGGMAKAFLESNKKGSVISTFERMEALVTTDHSRRYTEWPKDQIKSSDRKEPYPIKNVLNSSLIQQFNVTASEKAASQSRLRGVAQFTKQQGKYPVKHKVNSQAHHQVDQIHSGIIVEDNAHSELDVFSGSVLKERSFLEEPRFDAPPVEDEDTIVNQIIHQESSILQQDKIHDMNRINGSEEKKFFSRKILNKAENLLSRLKKTTSSIPKGETISKPINTDNKSEDANSNFPVFLANADDLTSQIKAKLVPGIYPQRGMDKGVRGDELGWLMRGVPEAYDDDAIIEDEVIDKLIKEGGSPPSQLNFPSLYATSQKTLLNLGNAKVLSLTITELNVYSARFGVRKDASYFVIRCPAGCTVEESTVDNYTTISGDDTQVITMDLQEHDQWRQINTSRKKNVLTEYFVGSKVMDLTVKWNISVTDALIADWLSTTTESNAPPISSMIHIDVYSYLLPPTSKKPSSNDNSTMKKRGWSSSAILLGSTDISMQVLLGSQSLSSFVSSDISLDTTSHATVADRLRRLPNYSQLGKKSGQQNPQHLGTMKCKLSLLDACSRPLGPPIERVTTALPSSVVAMRQIPGDAIKNPPVSSGADRLHTTIDDALNFVPEESRRTNNTNISTSNADIYKTTSKAVSVGIAVHSLTRRQSSGHWVSNIPSSGVVKIQVSYKVALSHESVRDTMETVLSAQHLLGKDHVDISGGHLHQFKDIMSWRIIYFEVWMVWREEKFLDETRKLLGLSKYPLGTDLGEAVSLAIINPSTGTLVGSLRVTLLFNDSHTSAQIHLEKCLTTEHVREVLLHEFDGPSSNESCSEKSIDCLPEPLHEESGMLAGIPQPEPLPVPLPQLDLASHNLHQTENTKDIAEEKHSQPKEKILPVFSSTEPIINDRESNVVKDFGLDISRSINKNSLQISSDSLLGAVENGTDVSQPVVNDSTQEITAKEIVLPSVDSKNEIPITNYVDPIVVSDNLTCRIDDDIGHILDVSIVGGFGNMTGILSRHFPLLQASLGCFICYSFPGLSVSGLERWNAIRVIRGGKYSDSMSVWWDRDCSILNSRNRHEFCVSHGQSSLSVLGCDNISEITFLVVPSDAEGNMPSCPNSIARFNLPVKVLDAIMGRAGFTQTVSLPLHFAGLDEEVSANIELCLSHRILPTSVRKSQALGQSREGTELVNSVKSHATETVFADGESDIPVDYDDSNSFSLDVSVDRLSCSSIDDQYLHDMRKVYVSCCSSSVATSYSTHHSASVSHFQTGVKMLKEFCQECTSSHVVSIPLTHVDMEHYTNQNRHALRSVTLLFSLHTLPDWGSDTREQVDAAGVTLGNEIIGTAVVSLCPLTLGYPAVSGWYYISNSDGHRVGQIKVTVKPKDACNGIIDTPDTTIQLSDQNVNTPINQGPSKISLSLQEMMDELEATRLSILGFNLGAGDKKESVMEKDNCDDISTQYSSEEFEQIEDAGDDSVEVDSADLSYSLLQPSPIPLSQNETEGSTFEADKFSSDDSYEKYSTRGNSVSQKELGSDDDQDDLSFTLLQPSPESKHDRLYLADNDSKTSQDEWFPHENDDYEDDGKSERSVNPFNDMGGSKMCDTKDDNRQCFEFSLKFDDANDLTNSSVCQDEKVCEISGITFDDIDHNIITDIEEYTAAADTNSNLTDTCVIKAVDEDDRKSDSQDGGSNDSVEIPSAEIMPVDALGKDLTISLEQFLLDIHPDTHSLFDELNHAEIGKNDDDTANSMVAEFTAPVVGVMMHSLPIIVVEDIKVDQDLDASTSMHHIVEVDNENEVTDKNFDDEAVIDETDKEFIIPEEKHAEEKQQQVESAKMNENTSSDEILSCDNEIGIDSELQAPSSHDSSFAHATAPHQCVEDSSKSTPCEQDDPDFTPRLCLCPKCVQRPPAQLDQLTGKFKQSKCSITKRVEVKRPSYEDNLRNDVFEVSRIIQSAMAASGMNAPPVSSMSWKNRNWDHIQQPKSVSQHVTSEVFPDEHRNEFKESSKIGLLHAPVKTRKKFLDAETDRISKIMLGSMMKYSSSVE